MALTIALSATSKDSRQEKQYIARLTGRDSKYTFHREFCGRRVAKGYTTAEVDQPGIYEVANIDGKGRKTVAYRIILATDGGLISLRAHSDYAEPGTDTDGLIRQLVTRMDSGEALEGMIQIEQCDGSPAYRVLNKAAAMRAEKARTIDSGVDDCWQVLQAFPDDVARKILGQLKKRLTRVPEKVEAAE